MMNIELPEPLPCPCCENTNLCVGATSASSQGVHCVHIDDDIVSRLLMMNRNNKKKQQEQENEVAVIDPARSPQLPEQEQYTQQVPQAPQTPVQQPTQQPVQQPTQPVQQQEQFVPEAVIIQGWVTEERTYKYTVETNYPLAISHCKIIQ